MSKRIAKYRNYIMLNKNLLLAAISAISTSALVSQFNADLDSISNSLISGISDSGTYIATFVIFFYIDNRHRYNNPLTRRSMIINDFKKLAATFSIAEVIYFFTKSSSHYYFLGNGFEPYAASTLGSIAATGIYFLSINLGIKISRFFKDSA